MEIAVMKTPKGRTTRMKAMRTAQVALVRPLKRAPMVRETAKTMPKMREEAQQK